MKNFNQEKYLEDLKEIENLNLLQYKNANVMFNVYQYKLINIIDKRAPSRVLSWKEQKLKLKPWITKSILNLSRKKNELYRKYIKTQSRFWYCRYKYYRNTINTLITKSKRNHLRNFFQENCTNF